MKENPTAWQTSSLASANDSTASPSIATPISTDSTTTKQQQYTASSPPRPLFPWRHELVPPPRLLEGTPEYAEAPPSLSHGFFGRRLIALWLLQLRPVWSVVTGRFETELATSAAYAFGQAVAGIVSNVYRIPFATVGNEGSVTFRYDPSTEGGVEALRQPAGVNDGATFQKPRAKGSRAKTKQNQARRYHATRKGRAKTNQNQARRYHATRRACTSRKRPLTQRSSRSLIYVIRKSSGARVYRRAPRRLVLQKKRSLKMSRKRRKKANRILNAATSETLESKGPQGTYCASIGEMVSPQLRELYKSAHSSGKDQLLVHLDMEPLSGRFISLTGIPLCNRKMAAEDPALFRRLFSLFKSGTLRENDLTLLRELDREGDIETTIELQVWVECKERFSVVDRVTGVTVQGNDRETHTPQMVGHLVRLEATVRVTREPSDGDDNRYLTVSNWIVTDIDDLLGHRTWYHVLLDTDE